MQDLKDLKRFFRGSNARGGNPLGCAYGIRGPPRDGEKNVPFTVGRGPVPRRATRLKQDLQEYHDLPRL